MCQPGWEGVWGRMDTCICIAESLCCSPKTTTTLFIGYAIAKLLQLCPTLCDPMDSSPPGSPVPGILQAWTLEWVAISFSNAWKWKVKVKSVMSDSVRPHGLQPSRLLHPWDFSSQEYWSGLPYPSTKCLGVKKKITKIKNKEKILLLN